MKALFVFCFCFLVCITQAIKLNDYFGPLDISKTIDETQCCTHTVGEINECVDALFPLVRDLEKKTYFKIFRINVEEECAYWAVSRICTSQGKCDLCVCNEDDIPVAWRKEESLPETSTMMQMDTFMDLSSQQEIWDPETCDSWFPKSEVCGKDIQYVDLLLNPHSNTGYGGDSARKIWSSIYKENCFKGGEIEKMCHEEKVFFKILSGIQSVTDVAVCKYFELIDPKNKTKTYDSFLPNLEKFASRLHSNTEKLGKLYYLFGFVGNSLIKISPFLKDYEFHTGGKDDKETKELVTRLLNTLEDFGNGVSYFNDTNSYEHLKKLEKPIRTYFYNITKILNCVECEKCKMWSKIEMIGLSVAMKIFLRDDDSALKGIFEGLERTEIIALVTLFNQIVRAITNFEEMSEILIKKMLAPYVASFFVIVGLIFFVIALLYLLIRKKNKKGKKAKKNL